MRHVDCTEYPLIGWLLSRALATEKKIHRTTLVANAHGRINMYFHEGVYILECDTNGDHNPNDYYFFRNIEEGKARQVVRGMCELLGECDAEEIEKITSSALAFLRN